MMSVGPRRSLAALRWGVAALAVAAAHGALGWAVVHWRVGVSEAAAGAPEQAIMIELAALSVAPEAPPEELPPATEPVAPEPVKDPPPPEVEPELEPPPLMPEPVFDPPPPEPEPEPEPVQLPEPEIKLPEIPQLPDPAAVLAPPPPPKPPEKPKVVEKPKPKPKPRVVQKPKPERPRAERAAAPPPSQRAAAPNPPAPGTAVQSSVSNASWRGSLIAHLNRHKRFPGGASPGTVQVAFSIDRGGRVLSARLVGSSGDAALDQEAVAMIRRASPVPAPPAGVGGAGNISLAVPIRYTR